jgi:hypothetical protein
MRAIEAAILASDVSGIVVCGPAGVGKSRIAREALSAAESRGCEGRWAVGTSAARTLPLGAFTAWAQSGVTDTVQLVRGVIESLTSAPAGTAVAVAVDDVHLLDDLSAFVVQQIVQRGAAKVLLTVRDGEPIPAAVQEIWRGGQFDRLDLQPLSFDETTTLLSASLGGSVDPDAVQRLWTLTYGNALYLRNIVEQEVADGRLEMAPGYWRWTGDPIVAPTRLRRLRGLVAAELAASEDRDDIRLVVRRATLSLDSDLAPDSELLVKAAHGAVWLADLPLADRLAEAAIRAGAEPEANFIRAHALSWLSRGEEADMVLAKIDSRQLTDGDQAKSAFLRASNMLWVLADPAGAKELIDEASRTSPTARSYVDAFHTVYWFAMDKPGLAMQASKGLALDDLPAVVDAEIALGARCHICRGGAHDRSGVNCRCWIRRCDALFGRTADEVQYRGCTRQRTAAFGSGQGRDRGGTGNARSGGRSPGHGAIARCCSLGSGRTRRRPARYRLLVAGAGSTRVVRLGVCHRLGVPLSRSVRNCPRYPGLDERGDRSACRAR